MDKPEEMGLRVGDLRIKWIGKRSTVIYAANRSDDWFLNNVDVSV